MQQITRALLALLLLNLSLLGRELACTHEPVADRQSAPMHDRGAQHHAELPSEKGPPPCEDSAAQCCDALASCSITAMTGRAGGDDARPDVRLALIAGADFHRSSAPSEVATPPPKA